jgi:fucose permease
MNAPLKAYSKLWVLYLFVFMMVLGIAENIRSVFVPMIKAELKLQDQGISGLMMVGTLGSVILQFVGGFLLNKIGYRYIYHLACLFCVLPLLFIFQLNHYYSWLFFFLVLHSGFTIFSLATNALVPRMGENAPILLNITHGCYGLGAMLSPWVAGFFTQNPSDWKNAYLWIAGLFSSLWLVLLLLGNRGYRSSAAQLVQQSISPIFILKNPFVWLFGILFGTAISAEVATSSWMVNYLVEVKKWNQEQSSLYLFIFFALFTGGRLVGGFVVQKIGELKAIKISMILSITCLTLGLVLPSPYEILLSISGCFFSVIFPSLVMILNRFFKSYQSHILGIVAAFALLIYLLFNGFIGYFNDHYSKAYSFYFMPMSMTIALICLGFVEYFMKKIKQVELS